MARAKKSKADELKVEKVVEPRFPDVVPGILPPNLKVIRVAQAFPGQRFDLAKTPAMCLSRLSALVDSAGGTEAIKQYLSSEEMLNVSFQSYINGEITFHCVGDDGSGVPDRHRYSVSFSVVTERPKEFFDIVHRVGAGLYGWRAQDIDASFAACADKAKRRLQKDIFGVIPDYGSVRGMECYLTSTPKVVLFAPDVD